MGIARMFLFLNMKRSFIFILILASACNQPDNSEPAKADSTVIVTYDTIPEIRKSIQAVPVAAYSEPINDELNDWKFAVSLQETKRTFHYTVHIQAKEVRITDSVTIPNFGMMPRPEVHKGKEPMSCIIGFLDKNGVFKEYRKVSFQNDRLRITTLNTYYVGALKTKLN